MFPGYLKTGPRAMFQIMRVGVLEWLGAGAVTLMRILVAAWKQFATGGLGEMPKKGLDNPGEQL